MKIYTELHHLDLYHSLQLLFEKRLGHELYRPTGDEWFTNGFWHIARPYQNNPSTVNQYLGNNDLLTDKEIAVRGLVKPEDGIYYFEDKHNSSIQKGIEFLKFIDTKFDIIIASIPEHIEPYKVLIREFQPQAKLIVQVGNIWWDKSVDFSTIPNLMSSTIEYPVPASCNTVFYHQEFDLDIFKPQGIKPQRKITSFVNCLLDNAHGHYFYELKLGLPEIDFRSYGGSNENGVVNTTQEIANIMNESMFGFHAKKDGDGFGHILHNWFAVGKPVITSISDYQDKLGGKLLIDMETCIDLDKHSIPEVCDIIRDITPLKYEWMCQQVYQKFQDVVDYELEQMRIESFLTNLK